MASNISNLTNQALMDMFEKALEDENDGLLCIIEKEVDRRDDPELDMMHWNREWINACRRVPSHKPPVKAPSVSAQAEEASK